MKTEQDCRTRMLTADDVIQIGDEMLPENEGHWERINGGPTIGEHWMIGCKYNPAFFVPMRRQTIT